jgi:hypothetical protein
MDSVRTEYAATYDKNERGRPLTHCLHQNIITSSYYFVLYQKLMMASGFLIAKGRNSIGPLFTNRLLNGSRICLSTDAKENVPSITLYQYTICPFCNIVKAAASYVSVDYKIVEVNPLTKAELKWCATGWSSC